MEKSLDRLGRADERAGSAAAFLRDDVDGVGRVRQRFGEKVVP
jgi:hypothetical protein